MPVRVLLAAPLLAGTALVREWTGWAIVMDPSDLPEHRAGEGPVRAIEGLVVLLIGAVCAAVAAIRDASR